MATPLTGSARGERRLREDAGCISGSGACHEPSLQSASLTGVFLALRSFTAITVLASAVKVHSGGSKSPVDKRARLRSIVGI